MSILEVNPPASLKPNHSGSLLLRPPLLLAGVLGLACLPLLAQHAQTLWEKPHYQFFPWATIGAGVLAWRRREKLTPLTPGLPALSYALLALSWLLLAAAGYLVSPWLGMVAALVTLIGYLWLLGGHRLVVALLPSLILLAVLVPPPLRLDERLVLVLQTSTVDVASRALDWLELPHVPFAHTLQVPGDQLLVDEACSGIASLFSVVTFSLFFGFFFRRHPVHLVLLVCFAVLFVGLGNIVRVTGITILKSRYNIDLVNGWKHEAAGLVIFAFCLALLASMDQGLLFFTDAVSFLRWRKKTRPASASPTAKATVPAERLSGTTTFPTFRNAVILSGAFACAGLLALVNGWLFPRILRDGWTVRPLEIASIQQKTNADFLPKQIGRWEQQHYERTTRSSTSPTGHYSDVWRYQQGKWEAIVSIDYPFRGGHDLTQCYSAQGWHNVDTSYPTFDAEGEAQPTAVAVYFERSFIEKSYLWFSLMDERGRWLEANALHNDLGMSRLADRFMTTATATTVQVQVFLPTSVSREESGQQEAARLFQEVRPLVHRRLFATGQEQP